MNYEKLESLFIQDPSNAIEESKKIITNISGFNSFQEFISYHSENSHFSYCPKPFTTEYRYELSVFCLDCTLNNDDLAFICLPCFMNGNHEGHNYFIFPGLIGHCDCGDKFHIKCSGFCSKHQSCDDDNLENYLNEQLRTNLTDNIFKASFTALQTFKSSNYEKSIEILEFIILLFSLGDGFRRLFIRTITEKIDFTDLINSIPSYDDNYSTLLTTIFSFLLHDQLFMRHFSKTVFSLLSDQILQDSPNCMTKSYSDINYDKWFSFFFQCFSEPICRYNIEINRWDWVSFCIELLTYFKDLLIYVKKQKYQSYPSIFSIIKSLHFLTSIQPNEETQNFFDKIVTEVFNSGTHENTKSDTNDTIIVVSFKRMSFLNHFKSFFDFLTFFHYIFYCFVSKPNLKLDKLIDELDKKIDITPIFMINKNFVGKENGKKNENDKLISRFLTKEEAKQNLSFFDKFKSTMKNIFQSYPSKYYKSILNGGSFFLNYPLYDSFCMIFNLDDLCRFKLAKYFSIEKYQPLRIKLGIITMKKLLSSIYFDLGITNISSRSLNEVYEKIYESRKQIRFNLMPVSILQFLIGIQCNNKNNNDEFILKEFFAFELAREFALFDPIYNEKNSKIVFAFFYVALLIVIDRTLFHDNDGHNVTEEQIIFALKRGVSSIDALNEMCDRNDKPGEYFTAFNEILMKVATKNTNNPVDEKDEDAEESNISLSQLRNNGNDDEDDDNENYHDNEEEEENGENDELSENSERKISNSKNAENKKESQNSYIKPVNFYLKEGIECKLISSVIPISLQKSFMNIEVSKNQNKLLRIQKFEPEETFFFNSSKNTQNTTNNNDNSENDNNNNDNDNDEEASAAVSDDFKICIKQFLLTPTVFAVVYDQLRQRERLNKQENSLNDHLAMNILILASRFVKEKAEFSTTKTKFNENENISYLSLTDFISKIKKSLFNHRIEGKGDEEKAFIEDTLNPSNFSILLKTKFEPLNLPPKSFIDLLAERGTVGEETLHEISQNIQIDSVTMTAEKEKENDTESKEKQIKTLQKQKAAKLKEDIMNQYSNIRNHYHFSESVSDSFLLSSSEIFSPNKKVCSLCSESKKKEILSYPLYIYRTKLPFIFDKPPLVSKKTSGRSVDNNKDDFDKDDDFVEMVKDELNVNGKLTTEKDLENIENFKKTISEILNQQKQERKDLKIGKNSMKRMTVGANFVIQFGICPHPVHKSCVDDDEFICPIDRSTKNGFLPCLDDLPINKIFSDLNTFELSSNSLSSNIIESISSFVDRFHSFFDCLNSDSINVFIELIKSIGGLIETYEIRLRNLPSSLDSTKTKILSRNLFLAVWYAYRIQKKPKLTISGLSEIEIESRLTVFQKFIKLLIENDKIGADNCNVHNEIKEIVSSILENSFSSDCENEKRKEKEICLFLKRVCLSEFFLLNVNLGDNENELIEWDDILATESLSKRYDVEFKTIDLSQFEEFEFKPFVFTKLPKEFLKLSQSPYFLPIENIGAVSLYNLLDYNHLIKYYDDFDDVQDEIENDQKNNSKYDQQGSNESDDSQKDTNNNKGNENPSNNIKNKSDEIIDAVNENNKNETNNNDENANQNNTFNKDENIDNNDENTNQNNTSNKDENIDNNDENTNQNNTFNKDENIDNNDENANQNNTSNKDENINNNDENTNQNNTFNKDENIDNNDENANQNNTSNKDENIDNNDENTNNSITNNNVENNNGKLDNKDADENENSSENNNDSNASNSEGSCNNRENIGNDTAVDIEMKKNQRAIQFCDAEFLSYLMTFYGKRHYPSVFMFTGAISPQIFLVDQSFGAALDTFYVDRYGCPDVNHLRFQPLFLNEERYEKLIDQILSGDFSYNLQSLDKLRDDDSSE